MSKLTIEIEENEYALYDVRATLDDRVILASDNYTSEDTALADAYDMAGIAWGLR